MGDPVLDMEKALEAAQHFMNLRGRSEDQLYHLREEDQRRVDDMCRALSSHKAAGGWRPIAEAPKDGTAILTWGCMHADGSYMGEHPSIQKSRWMDDAWFSFELGGHEPTHFMPLPSPPAEGVSSARADALGGLASDKGAP